jgi:prepilin-type N-terminal cleavage/methylation domain-containing protein
MSPRRSAFTLIELLAALAIAMILAGLCTTALVQIRNMVQRAQLRIGLHQRAESIHTHLDNIFSSLLHSGPLVVDMVGDGGGATPRLRLLAMTAKTDNWDWNWPTGSGSMNMDTSDIRWQLVDWNAADRGLYAATSTPSRTFSQYDTSLKNPAKPNIDFLVGNARFINAPQPRRRLEFPVGTAAATWAEATRALDGNMLFPNLAVAPAYPDTPYASLAGNNPDRGDWGDLMAQRAPIATGVTDFRLSFTAVDGRVAERTFDRGTSSFHHYEGAWLDGDLGLVHGATTGTADAALSGPIGRRPRLARVSMTLEERLRPYDPAVVDSDETRIQQTFLFSFLLPGNAGPPTNP